MLQNINAEGVPEKCTPSAVLGKTADADLASSNGTEKPTVQL